jgi:predicted solute-binding protein
MKIHVLITLATSTMLHESGATALDLDSASSLLLNVLHISATVTNDLSAKIETWNWFKVDGNLLLGPFALFSISYHDFQAANETYSAKLISLNGLWFSSTKSSFIYQIR